MGFSELMEKKMNEILITAEEMLQELDKELEGLRNQIGEIESRRDGVENLRQDALKALGIAEEDGSQSKGSKKKEKSGSEETTEDGEEENLLEEEEGEEELDTSFLDE